MLTQTDTAMTDQKKFTARLTAALAKTGWSQSELARRAGGMRRDAISTYCMGATLPSEPFQKRIAEALGGTVDDLMKGRLPSSTLPPAPAVVARVEMMTKRQAARVGRSERAERRGGPLVVDIHQCADGSLVLRIDHRVTMEQAQRILTILAE